MPITNSLLLLGGSYFLHLLGGDQEGIYNLPLLGGGWRGS